ncbi:MAG: DUF1284 domain-containing protein [Methanobrevibacter sp.]|uniref:DUF1284 domain-containing protein n=1 Tax=Methanobrevibacter sp. TaxID=66852 RepID=UPI0025CE3E20|nr:DUF1284 domain-containing protein [Methanobrevibacter sp.]MBR0271572.1 DUF1284 domain-containing protein [Methanobrevibacter sp.]
MKIRLRGHHLLCLQGFQGYGYSEDFVLNMVRINEMRKSADCTVTLTNEPDDICSACPNLKDNLCENKKQNEIIVEMDNEVLSHLNMNNEYNSIDLFNEVASIFNSSDSVENICNECKWAEKCLFYKKLI